jgi:hypothetical protein
MHAEAHEACEPSFASAGVAATHTQGLPRHRLPLMPAQNVSSPVPGRHSHPLWEMTHDTAVTRHLCGLDRERRG